MNYQTLLIYNLNGILVLLLKRWYIYFLGRLKILLYSWVRYITQQTITNIENKLWIQKKNINHTLTTRFKYQESYCRGRIEDCGVWNGERGQRSYWSVKLWCKSLAVRSQVRSAGRLSALNRTIDAAVCATMRTDDLHAVMITPIIRTFVINYWIN